MPIFADNLPAGKCACQFVKSGDEVVLDYACALHEKWRDGAVEAEARVKELESIVSRYEEQGPETPIKFMDGDMEREIVWEGGDMSAGIQGGYTIPEDCESFPEVAYKCLAAEAANVRLAARCAELEGALEKIAESHIAGYCIGPKTTQEDIIKLVADFYREFSSRVNIARQALAGNPSEIPKGSTDRLVPGIKENDGC